MATWVNNTTGGVKSGTRRRWDLEDRASLNNLKYHIAAEGCSEVQYDLAKQLLEKKIEPDEQPGNQQAVYWLLCAARQGHEEAVNLLRQCYKNGDGITSENINDVHACLSMTSGERAARKAARELFACLANGNEHITPKQLERKMRKIYNLQKKRRRGNVSSSSEGESEDDGKPKLLDKAVSEEKGNGHLRERPPSYFADMNAPEANEQNDVITEENLVTAAVNYTAGRLPAVSDALTLSVPHPASLDHVPCFHRLLFHPVIFCTLLYHRLINFVSALPTSIPSSVRLAALFLIYFIASSENLIVFIPIGFYYLCLCVMVWSTCTMLKTKHEFIDFRIWSGLFLSYGDHNIEADMSENRFLKNNMKPYLYFFCAFVGSMIIYPLLSSEWLLHSELTIISCVFVFVSLVAFMRSSGQPFPDWVVLISFGVNVLAKYPYEMDKVVTTRWRFLDLKVPTFSSFVLGNGIEFCLSCRTALYLLIPGFLILMAKRSNWRGTYRHLIPHCVTLSWLQLCINTSQSATMFGVVRATFGLAGILLFLPLFGIVSLLIPVFVAIEWMGFTDPNIRMGSTVVATAVALFGSCFLALNRTTQKYITAVQVIACVTAASVLTFPYMTSSFKEPTRFDNIRVGGKHGAIIQNTPTDETLHAVNYLSWQRFNTLCGSGSWENKNKINTQLRCAHLEGVPISWTGSVEQVQLKRVTNWYNDLITKYLPPWLANFISCLYGQRINEHLECNSETDPLCEVLQKVLKESQLLGAKCSLHNWNSYEYEIIVAMPTSLLSKSANVVLQATHNFGNFTRAIVVGDEIKFHGNLQNSRWDRNYEREDYVLGSTHAQVDLIGVECIACQAKHVPSVVIKRSSQSPVNARMRDLMRGIKYLLNVLLNPLITFK